MTEAPIIEAAVQVGVVVTPYLRCGRGDSAVVVLALDDEERLRLLTRYATGRCVIAPVPLPEANRQTSLSLAPAEGEAAAAAVEAWLRGVVDGLGLDRPAVVLGPDFTWIARWLGERCSDWLELEPCVHQDR